MKKTILKSTKSILIAAAICASLVFGVFATTTPDSTTLIAASYPSSFGNY